jgi:hypothetical protein
MAHEFIILRKNVLETYDKYEDIPEDFDHIIKFLPEIPDGPHTHEQHEEIDAWNEKLQLLLEKERNARSNKNR